MSDRAQKKRDEKATQQPLPSIPTPYCDAYRYTIDGHGVVTIWAGRGGEWHAAMSLPLSLVIDLHQKIGVTIADTLRNRSAVPAEFVGPNGASAGGAVSKE